MQCFRLAEGTNSGVELPIDDRHGTDILQYLQCTYYLAQWDALLRGRARTYSGSRIKNSNNRN